MAYAFSVTRVTLSGTCFGSAEIWSTGFFVGYEDAGASNPTQAAVDDIAVLWQAFFQHASSSISNDYFTTQVKMAQLTTAGETMPNNVVYHNYAAPIAGASASSTLPPQLSMVCTLASSLPRGLASKGRMYLPGYNAVVDQATGKVSSLSTGLLADRLEIFFEGVNTELGVAGDVILASQGSTTPTVQAGVNKVVTTIKVGDVYDTQRRRRNGLSETYVSRAIAA